MIELYKHQSDVLNATIENKKVGYFLDMGLGKTFVGSEKMRELDSRINLVICQKSKVNDWIEHFEKYYGTHALPKVVVYDLSDKRSLSMFINYASGIDEFIQMVGVINYELAFRRSELRKLKGFTLMLDESSMIQNETAKRSKFISELNFENLILLSGTPTGGKYEKLYSQLNMLGYNISRKAFYNMYVDYHYDDNEGFPVMIIDGYKNVERLKRKMRQYGCVFMKTEEVFDLPQQNFIDVKVNSSKEYRTFKKDCIAYVGGHWVEDCKQSFHGIDKYVGGTKIVGDTILNKMLGERQLCGAYNTDKLGAYTDLLESTNDRLIVFYNFNNELDALKRITKEYTTHISEVNGTNRDLTAYEKFTDSVTFIQYQAGAMGLNLQKANKIVYFTPPLSSELFEQSKKRIHRIGQAQPCFYYKLICKNSIEQKIYKTLDMRRDYTDKLFERGE